MEPLKLNHSEFRLMELIWENAEAPAKEIALKAGDAFGWNKNTTYTVLKGLVGKQAVERREPGFCCVPLVTEEQIQHQETKSHIDRFYKGSVKLFFSSLFENEELSGEELDELRRMIEGKEEQRRDSR